ncbi:MAG TPA: hypothetical protein VGC91_05430 [Pyrinomonadaceae bacterium]
MTRSSPSTSDLIVTRDGASGGGVCICACVGGGGSISTAKEIANPHKLLQRRFLFIVASNRKSKEG